VNEPAFPHLIDSCQRMNESEMHPGLSIRDYFAAAALTGVLVADELARHQVNPGGMPSSARDTARAAYEAADAMLAARTKETT
jgi:hypothetical protein